MEVATAIDRPLQQVEDVSDVTRSRELSDITAVKIGLRFRPDTSYETWRAVGAKLGERTNTACWWVGDWLLFGERNYRRYRDAIDATGLDYRTLRNYAAVARRFPLSVDGTP